MDEMIKLIQRLADQLEMRQWQFDDESGYERNSCITCGAVVLHGSDLKHKSDCELKAALDEAEKVCG